MELGKIKPVATLVAQFPAGIEVDAINHEGKIFLPVMSTDTFSKGAGKDSSPESPAEPPAKKSKPSADGGKYTENALMDMDVKELSSILNKEFNINPDDYDGKNTNKKLRLLILDAQNGGSKPSDEEPEEEPKSKKPGKQEKDDEPEDDLKSKVADLLQQFDSGNRNRKKTLSAILDLSEDADEDKVNKLFKDFEDDEDASIDDFAAKIAKALSSEEDSPAPSKGKNSKEQLVDPDDLEVGDEVSVWWDDDNKDWFNGTVSAIKKGKVYIKYEDDSEDALDPEYNTKVKLIKKA